MSSWLVLNERSKIGLSDRGRSVFFSSANLIRLQRGGKKVAIQQITVLPIICPPTTVLTLQDGARDTGPVLPQQAHTTEGDRIISSM